MITFYIEILHCRLHYCLYLFISGAPSGFWTIGGSDGCEFIPQTLWLDLQSYYKLQSGVPGAGILSRHRKVWKGHRQNSHLGHTDTLSTFVYALIWTKTAYPCDPADTEQRTQFTFQRIFSKMLYADAEEINCWIKSLFWFSLCTKSILVAL